MAVGPGRCRGHSKGGAAGDPGSKPRCAADRAGRHGPGGDRDAAEGPAVCEPWVGADLGYFRKWLTEGQLHLEISLSDFRCFAKVDSVPIAPITLLIGENSSGKTSFLAALRELVQMFNLVGPGSFNSAPYYLGGFEQIAFYKGGSRGRAKSFALEIALGSSAGETKIDRKKAAVHRLVFTKGEIQPELSRYEVSASEVHAIFDLSSAVPKVSVNVGDGEVFSVQSDLIPKSFFLRKEVAFFGFYLQNFFSMAGDKKTEELNDSARKDINRLGTILRRSSGTMVRSIFASEPVRFQPRRVYTPSELAAGSGGELVPLQMANMKLRSPESWKVAKAKLNAFGQKTGLFADIDVKRLGKTIGDPFQIQVKALGQSANLVDVGYGVSQALPLLVPLQDGDHNFFLLQQPEVHLHPRAQAEFGSLIVELLGQKPDSNYVIETHSDYIVDRIRSEVHRGTLDYKQVSILYFQKQGREVTILPIELDSKGDIVNPPLGYRDFFLAEQARVLGL